MVRSQTSDKDNHFSQHKNLKKYKWFKKWREGTMNNDRFKLYDKFEKEKRTEKQIRKYIDVVERIGSPSMHAEVYKTIHEEVIKIVPISESSDNELLYLEMFSDDVKDGYCEHFPLFYQNVCYNDIIYQNDKLSFDAFDGLVSQNCDICKEYIMTNLHLMKNENVVSQIKKKLSCEPYKTVLNSVKLAWKVYKAKCMEYDIVLPPIRNINSYVFLVEKANGDLCKLIENKVLTSDDIKHILFGAFYALYYIDTKFDLSHGDLHGGNVLVSLFESKNKKYIISGKTYLLKDVRYLSMLWDFETVKKKRYVDETLKNDVDRLLSSLITNCLQTDEKIKGNIENLIKKDRSTWSVLFDAVYAL